MTSSTPTGARVSLFRPGGWPLAVLLLVFVVAGQIAVGAYRSERGLYSDEAAHFMNGLVLRDYVYDGFGQNPMAFAEDYYAHYPKIAPFMWPPLFHGVLGLFLLPGWSPQPAAIFLLGLFATWSAWRLHAAIVTFASIPVSVGAVGLFLGTPAVVALSSSVMVDTVIAALAIEAAYWLAKFFMSESVRDAAVFGLFVALGCLAKGNGVALVLMPFFMILITGRYAILRRAGLYVSALIVVVIAVPLLVVSYRLDASIGDFGPLGFALIWERTQFYAVHIWRQLGTAPLLFAAVGLVALTRPAHVLSTAAGSTHGFALVALVAAAFAFHVVSPHLLSHQRYITLALAPLLGLTALGVFWVSRVVPWPSVRWSLQIATFAAMAVVHLAATPPLRAQVPLGYRALVTALHQTNALADRRLLVVSDEFGEGACVVEVAVLGLTPAPTVIRGSKFLASDDWMGRNFHMRYASPDAVFESLVRTGVDYILLDSSAGAAELPYWGQMHQMIAMHPDRIQLLSDTPVNPEAGPLRPLRLYRLR